MPVSQTSSRIRSITVFAQKFEAVFSARARADLVLLILKNAAQRFAYAGFVVDDKNMCHTLFIQIRFTAQPFSNWLLEP